MVSSIHRCLFVPLARQELGGLCPGVGRAGWGRAANLAKAMRVPEQVLTPGRKVTSVLELSMTSADGRESGLDLSEQTGIQKSFLLGITVHGVIPHSQQQISP